MRLAIVDDSRLFRERLHAMLAGTPGTGEIRTAGDFEAGRLLVESFRPDVVILDIHLPGGSGIDLLRLFKAGRAEERVIVLTAFSYPQYRKACLELGAELFLDKTADLNGLATHLRSPGDGSAKGWERLT